MYTPRALYYRLLLQSCSLIPFSSYRRLARLTETERLIVAVVCRLLLFLQRVRILYRALY